MPGTDKPRFRNDMAVPPGGLYFYEIETGAGPVRFESSSMEDLDRKIRLFCNANSHPFPVDLNASVQEFMCPRIQDGFCTTPGLRTPARMLTLQGVKDVTRLIVRKALSSVGTFLAPQGEAERRASICLTCPNNSVQGCTVCSGLLQLVRQLVGRRETKYDQYLGVCTLCGCLLRTKVHISAEGLKAATTPPPPEKIPAACWLEKVYYPTGS